MSETGKPAAAATSKATPEATPVAEMTFEAAIAELEEVVNRLDSGEVPLEQSIELYERGARLKAHCQTKLAEAEERVTQITQGSDGQPTGTRPLDAG